MKLFGVIATADGLDLAPSSRSIRLWLKQAKRASDRVQISPKNPSVCSIGAIKVHSKIRFSIFKLHDNPEKRGAQSSCWTLIIETEFAGINEG